MSPQASDEEIRKVVNRLKRARGQLTAVIDAMEDEADCRDVVIQLAAVGKAIDRAGFSVISTALRSCVTDAEQGTAREDDAPTVAELEKLFLTLA
ncbi:metal-sensitive transcriptional regulator [Microbacterium esteraromaticum]|uniref:Metal-sensitive transcriptional regulator n=1 Tax=Microbacterium esteraromaticum TaxID=57043 RepID=A0A939IUN3_9MICO|nr:metal-sensitive transcriptional regulator [Microbacterium esteraromaticum]MBN7793874.1 metal-sensitive transcriptional regulator [Microbacterium esteraromaticum]MBN8204818.1 metal-sensitive transcriptional regulator [Microbacterium esteraromaticum]MBN8414972.1 metal-sensitive transcriptional regulator [Microbacterium esteraromaticum]MBN8424754.1 metal-sensitive transcriptional regulator [Microbacterium esteraromaticum]MCA1307340.1 metal-sensitive transcriptional regulator [Microbacterium es